MMLRPETDPLFADREASHPIQNDKGLWPTLAWFLALLIGTSLVGFILALSVFLVAFFRARAELNWTRTALLSASGVGFILFLAWLLNRDFPAGLLQYYVSLPWPLT